MYKNPIALLLFGMTLFFGITLAFQFRRIPSSFRFVETQPCEVPVGAGEVDVFCLTEKQVFPFAVKPGDQVAPQANQFIFVNQLIQSLFMQSVTKQTAIQQRIRPKKLLSLGICIDLNQASDEELEVLPGVGPSLVRKIKAARPFHHPQELLGVSGIGVSLLHRLLPLVCVSNKIP